MDAQEKPNKQRYTLTLTKQNVDDAEEIQKQLSGGKNISALLDGLLSDWVKEQKGNEVFEKIMQEALENLREEKISNKDLTAIGVLNNVDKRTELLNEVKRIVKKKKKDGGKS